MVPCLGHPIIIIMGCLVAAESGGDWTGGCVFSGCWSYAAL